jgi:hypothetical protein
VATEPRMRHLTHQIVEIQCGCFDTADAQRGVCSRDTRQIVQGPKKHTRDYRLQRGTDDQFPHPTHPVLPECSKSRPSGVREPRLAARGKSRVHTAWQHFDFWAHSFPLQVVLCLQQRKDNVSNDTTSLGICRQEVPGGGMKEA